MDEGARLELVCAATYRGFESLSLRHLLVGGLVPHWFAETVSSVSKVMVGPR